MEPTLIEKDQLIVEKLSYSFSNPKRGDIVVFIDELEVDDSLTSKLNRLYDDIYSKFFNKEGHIRLVKRVIGLPGDIVDIKDGTVYVNGERIDEPYLSVPTAAKGISYPYKVEPGTYFCMGDNRTVSYDSRDFGSVDRSKIEGRVLLRFWPINKIELF